MNITAETTTARRRRSSTDHDFLDARPLRIRTDCNSQKPQGIIEVVKSEHVHQAGDDTTSTQPPEETRRIRGPKEWWIETRSNDLDSRRKPTQPSTAERPAVDVDAISRSNGPSRAASAIVIPEKFLIFECDGDRISERPITGGFHPESRYPVEKVERTDLEAGDKAASDNADMKQYLHDGVASREGLDWSTLKARFLQGTMLVVVLFGAKCLYERARGY